MKREPAGSANIAEQIRISVLCGPIYKDWQEMVKAHGSLMKAL